MNITLNGEAHAVEAGTTIATLIEALNIPLVKVAVERNLSIVSRSSFDQVILQKGDRIEIVRFIGGG
ncbi:MAG: thiamine biosynthesis protein ThiS [Robiginitomaculum sp.]|nr:MAG: thiamine biosynthesis protein ThiS [Robiginitomaculum sp.]